MPPSHDNSLPTHQESFADSMAGRFRRQLERRRTPRIEDYLDGFSEPFRGTLFLRLVKEELTHRRARGSHARAHDFLDRFPEYQHLLATQLGDDSVTGVAPPVATTTFEHRSLGRFAHIELLEEIGHGGGGTVYRARDLDLDRIVAIKFPHAEFLTAEQRQRFLREARAAAQLRHPFIASVYSVVESEGTIGLVSNFIPGVTLTEWTKVRRMEPPEVVRLVSRLARTLHAAHDVGIIHRDLKPDNVLLDIDGAPHIADFGLAKRLGVDETVTLDGQVVGTLSYMAPEQAGGRVAEHDQRSDIYSLGVMLYELLTGQRPFVGPMKTVLRDIQQTEPLRVRAIAPAISADLEAVCVKAMAKSPAARYQSAVEFADDLDRVDQGVAVVAPPPPAERRQWEGLLRSRWVAGAALAVLLAAGMALPYASSSAGVNRDENAPGDARVRQPLLAGLNPASALVTSKEFQSRPISLLELKPEVLMSHTADHDEIAALPSADKRFVIDAHSRAILQWPVRQPLSFRWMAQLGSGNTDHKEAGLCWNIRRVKLPGDRPGYLTDAVIWIPDAERRTWNVSLQRLTLYGLPPGAVFLRETFVVNQQEVEWAATQSNKVTLSVREGRLRQLDFLGVPLTFEHEIDANIPLQPVAVGVTVARGKFSLSSCVLQPDL